MSVLHTKNFLCLLRIQQLFYVCEFLARFGSLHHLGALSHSLADIRPRPGDAQFSSVLACSGRAAMYAVVHSYDATSLFDCVDHFSLFVGRVLFNYMRSPRPGGPRPRPRPRGAGAVR